MEPIGRTRMNLLLLRRRIEVAQRGLALLHSKREALVREFFAVMDRMVDGRGEMESVMGQALSSLTLALSMEGRASLRSAGYAARRRLSIELTERNVWGVRFPEVHYGPVIRAFDARGYAVSWVSAHIDETARRFEQVLELALRNISVEMRLKKLGSETKKVTRRINALHEVMIPALTREIRNIRQTLEEREREDLFRMKRFKT
ncbi:MAG: V-type ATP synthase subunit D [Nitrospira sp. LK70]|nr:V-type ATP synthase subunit D [Nitrospira sp. LK70]